MEDSQTEKNKKNSSADEGVLDLDAAEATQKSHANGVDTQALDAAKAEAEKFKNEFLYLRADFDNYRKNAIKERSDLVKYGAERLALNILDVLDIFETALTSPVSAENFKSFVQGMELTSSELKKVLQQHGLTSIDPLGQPFDPLLHEALGSEETEEYKPGYVSKVLRKAYKLHEKILRPAQVVVAKAPAK